MALRDWQTGWQGSLGLKAAFQREFAAAFDLMGAGRPEKSSEGCPLSVSAVPTKSCAARRANHAVGGSSLSRENIPFLFSRKSSSSLRPSRPGREGVAHVTNARWDAVDAALAKTNAR